MDVSSEYIQVSIPFYDIGFPTFPFIVTVHRSQVKRLENDVKRGKSQ